MEGNPNDPGVTPPNNQTPPEELDDGPSAEWVRKFILPDFWTGKYDHPEVNLLNDELTEYVLNSDDPTDKNLCRSAGYQAIIDRYDPIVRRAFIRRAFYLTLLEGTSFKKAMQMFYPD